MTQEEYLPPADRPLPVGEQMLACSCTPGVCEDGCTQCPWENCIVRAHEGGEKYTVSIDDEDVGGLDRRFLHASMPIENKVAYCMETKVFTVTLCVAHIDTTCGVKNGAEPRAPDGPGRHYDPVLREYVDREAADTWTLDRLYEAYTV